MNETIPAQAVVAIATVVAALITGVIAIVNLTLSKEQKVSELRHAWIDGLRDDLAKFFSGTRFVAVSLADERALASIDPESSDILSREKVADRAILIQEALYRVKLRLNIREPEHVELERLLEAVISTWDRVRAKDGDDPHEEVIASIERAVTQSRSILKTEWERVKRGERSFTRLRSSLLPMLLFFTVVFVSVILWVKVA